MDVVVWPSSIPTGSLVEFLSTTSKGNDDNRQWTEAVVQQHSTSQSTIKLYPSGAKRLIEVPLDHVRPRHIGTTWPALCGGGELSTVLVKNKRGWREIQGTAHTQEWFPAPRTLAASVDWRMHASGAGRCFEHLCLAMEEGKEAKVKAWLAFLASTNCLRLARAVDAAGFTPLHYLASPSADVTEVSAEVRVRILEEFARWCGKDVLERDDAYLSGGTATPTSANATDTPLFFAISDGHAELACEFVRLGARLSDAALDALARMPKFLARARALDAAERAIRKGKLPPPPPPTTTTTVGLPAMSLDEVCGLTGRQPVESQRFDQTLCPDVFETVNLWRQWRRRQKKGRMTRHDISWHDTPGKLTDIGLGDGRKVSEHTGVMLCELPMDDPARVYAPSLYANHRQFGVFATRSLASGEILGEYGGLVRTEESVNNNVFTKPRFGEDELVCAKTSHVYDHDLDFKNVEWAEGVAIEMQVDARVFCTAMAFVNDFRTDPLELGAASSSRSPNAAYEAVLDAEFWPRILVVATKTILPGEQVLADYGEGFWNLLRGFVHDRDEVERCIMDSAAVNKEALLPPPPPLPPPLPPPPLPLPLPAPAAPRSPSVHVVVDDDDDDDEPLLLEFAPPLVEDLTSPSLVEDLTGPSLVEDLTGSPPAAEDLTHQVLVIE
ncbi:SET domain-containing protein [Pycnococcus provasolii]